MTKTYEVFIEDQAFDSTDTGVIVEINDDLEVVGIGELTEVKDAMDKNLAKSEDLLNQTEQVNQDFNQKAIDAVADINQASGTAQQEIEQASQDAQAAIATGVADAESAASNAQAAQSAAEAAKDATVEISGLDTVEEAVELEMKKHNPYGAMTKAERNALREQRIREGAGSGVSEWGKHETKYAIVNEGIMCQEGANLIAPNTYRIGAYSGSSLGGVSRSPEPIIDVNGIQLHLNNGLYRVDVKHPTAPDGAKTLDPNTGEVRKYHNLAGVGTKYEVYTPDFEATSGSTGTHIQLPPLFMSDNAKVSMKVKFKSSSGYTGAAYLIDTNIAGNRTYIYRNATSKELHSGGFKDVTVNGQPASGISLEEGVEYIVEAAVDNSAGITVDKIGCRYGSTEYWTGEIWDIKLEDPELPSGFRHYPNLHHQDASLPSYDSNVIPVAEKGNLEAGWQVNYEYDGYVSVPDFPLADRMTISLSMRLNDADIEQRFGTPLANLDDARFYVVQQNSLSRVAVVLGPVIAELPSLTAGEIGNLTVDIVKADAPATHHVCTVTLNDTTVQKDVTFGGSIFKDFGLGGLGNGDSPNERWGGNIWDFKIEYPDAPDLNRYYKGIEPTDPGGSLVVIDEDGFTSNDYTINWNNTARGVIIPTWIPVGSNRVSVKYTRNLSVSEVLIADAGVPDGSGSTYFAISSAGEVYWSDEAFRDVTINGVPYNRYDYIVSNGETIVISGEMYLGRQITSLGNYKDFEMAGELTDVRLDDVDHPENSRYYPCVINSLTVPADDAPIVDELYDEATAPFYSPDWNSANFRRVDIPEMSLPASGGNWELEFMINRNGSNTAAAFVVSGYNNPTYAPICPYVTSDNGTTFSITNNANGTSTELYQLDRDRDYHIRYVVNDRQLQVYLDGVLQSGTDELSSTHVLPFTTIGGRGIDGFYFNGDLWNIRFTDNTDSTNSRYYPGTVYSPDSVPTGTVLEQTEWIYESGSDLVSEGWGATSSFSISGNVITCDTNAAGGASTAAQSAMVNGGEYTVEYSLDVSGSTGDIQLLNTRNSGSGTPSIMIGNGTGTYTGTWTFIAEGVDTANRPDAIYVRCLNASTGTTITVNRLDIRSADGTLVNFPADNEWTLAQVSGLSEGKPENFTSGVWNNDLPLTNGIMQDFGATPWEQVKFYNAELVGTTVWQPSSLQDSQKAFDYASRSDAHVIISRKDLSFVEVWDEKVSDKGILCRYGNTQSQVGTYQADAIGVDQGYCAFGEWDEDTVGRVELISQMTEAELKEFHTDHENNTWWDPEDREYYQTRFRIRTIEGLGDEVSAPNLNAKGWRHERPYAEYQSGLLYDYGSNVLFVQAKGKRDNNGADFGSSYQAFLTVDNPSNTASEGFVQTAVRPETSDSSRTYYIPLTLVQRLNQGAYHPSLNPQGTRTWNSNAGNWANREWFHDNIDFSNYTQVDAFIISGGNPDLDENFGAYRNSGYISSNQDGRQDQYRFYDTIYAGQVEDLRLPSYKQDLVRLREDEIRKAAGGITRGKGKVPFTFVTSDTANSNNSSSQFLHLKNVGNSEFNVGDKLTILDDSGNILVSGVSVIRKESSGNFALEWSALEGTYNRVTGERYYVVATQDILSAEYDSIPWVDIIGDPERIAATFPDGVVGQWIDKIPDGGADETFPMNMKAYNTAARRIITTNDGATWSEGGFTIVAATNSITSTSTNAANAVSLFVYEALSDFTESDDSRTVVGDLGDVHYSNNYTPENGNRFMPSLIGEIAHANNGVREGYSKVSGYAINNDVLWNHSSRAPIQHSPVMLTATTNDTDAVKALYHLIEKDGLLYLQYHATQLVHGGTDWGDDSEITIVNGESTKLDDNGNVVKVVTHTNMIPIGIAYNN